MDCSLQGSSIHGILQARVLEWVAMPSSRGSSQPRDWTQVSCAAGRFFTTEPRGKPFVTSHHQIQAAHDSLEIRETAPSLPPLDITGPAWFKGFNPFSLILSRIRLYYHPHLKEKIQNSKFINIPIILAKPIYPPRLLLNPEIWKRNTIQCINSIYSLFIHSFIIYVPGTLHTVKQAGRHEKQESRCWWQLPAWQWYQGQQNICCFVPHFSLYLT